jgi:hypothetical protein
MAREKVAFISYARKDGEPFATALKKRLEAEEPEITLWMDRAEMAGGTDFLDQLRRAIDAVEFLVLVMTPEAIASEWVQKEWRYAREQGVCVCPVKGADGAALDAARKSLPRWMSRAHTYDIDKEWERFTNFLKSPCQATRVPFMAPPLPVSFVRRPQEFDAIVGKVLDDKKQNPRGEPVVLFGSGGFGKTTLTTSLCHDDDVIAACDGGILWVTLGEQPSPLRELSKLYAALTGESRTFYDADDAAIQVFAKLENKRCLLVIDDVWDLEHVKPFLRAAPETTRLLTTRLVQVAGEIAGKDYRVPIAELTVDQSVELLTSRLDIAGMKMEPFRRLAARLGEWPLLLELANGNLREQMQFDETVEGALAWVNRGLDEAGVTAFDRTDAAARNQAIARTLEVSLGGLGDMRERCLELSIFGEDTDVPLALAGVIWKQNEMATRRIAQRLGNLSLIKLNLARNTFRIHDATRAYFATQLQHPSGIHGRLADAWRQPAQVSGEYAGRFAVYHLVEAMADPAETCARCRQLIELLSDGGFLALQGQHDAATVFRQLLDGLRRATLVPTPDMPSLVAGLAVAMRGYTVSHDPGRIFTLAHGGELRRATETVDLFDADKEWRAAALLTIAWIATAAETEEAAELIARAAAISDVMPLPALRAFASHEKEDVPGFVANPHDTPDLTYVAEILERAGGVASPSGIEPLDIEGINPAEAYSGTMQARFIADHDGPKLVAFARSNPATVGANTQYLRQYIAIHAANRYRHYRNRSLWALLQPILEIPDGEWARQLVEEIIGSALTITSIEFHDALPLTIRALHAASGDAQAAAALDAYTGQLLVQAKALTPERGKSDSWAHYQRRAAALAEIYATVVGQPDEALGLLELARTLPKGFAGFRSASSLTLAESCRIVTPADSKRIQDTLTSAKAAAHRIQDYPFCVQMTTFVNTMERRWSPARVLNVQDVVQRFVDDPTRSEFCPVFIVGEKYEFRPGPPNSLPIPDAVRQLRTLRGFAGLCQRPVETLMALNPGLAPDADLADGTEVHFSDEDFVPLLAARFAAEVLVSPGVVPQDRAPVIQRLVPLALANTTAADTVLSRLLMAAQPAVMPMPPALLRLQPAPWDSGITPSEAVLA